MKLAFYKQAKGFEEERTTIKDLLNIAYKNGMKHSEAKNILFDEDCGEILFDNLRMWSEEI